MTRLRVTPATTALRGSLPAPPDAASATLALLVMALATPGQTPRLQTRGLPRLPLVAALRALGVDAEQIPDGCRVASAGLHWQRSEAPLDAAGDVATAVGLSAALAGQRFASQVILSRPLPVGVLPQLIAPLRARGALIEGRLDPQQPREVFAPLSIEPAPMSALSPLQFQPSPHPWTGTAAGKAAALVSGLFADGPTLIQTSVISPQRCERLLRALGVPMSAAGPYLEMDGQLWDGQLRDGPLSIRDSQLLGDSQLTGSHQPPGDGQLPGDSGGAAALLAAAALVKDSLITVRGVAHAAGCGGYLEALRNASASLDVQAKEVVLGMGVADVSLRGAGFAGLRIGPALAARAGASGPLLGVLAAACRGGAHSELAMGETAAAGSLALLRAFGVEAEQQGGVLAVGGRFGCRLRANSYNARQDAELAMAATVLALQADGPCEITQCDAIAGRFPRFVASLRALGAHIDVLP